MTAAGTAATADDPLAALAARESTYVVAPLKLLYVSTAKNACTSLKWLIAELAGEDLDRFRPGTIGFIDPIQAIHQRELFERTPSLGQISPALRRTIRPDNGWFIWSVVRDPRIRLFSAWQNKFQLHDPRFRKWRRESWYPSAPVSATDVAANFARFVEVLATHPKHALLRNSHFARQTRWLRCDVVDYTRIYEIAELDTDFRSDLSAHLRVQGETNEVTLRRTNDTPLVANRQALPDPVCRAIEQIYADDFAAFGDRWDFAKIAGAPDWSAAALTDVNARIVAGERVHEILKELRSARRRAETAIAQRNALAAQLQEATDRPDSSLLRARLHRLGRRGRS